MCQYVSQWALQVVRTQPNGVSVASLLAYVHFVDPAQWRVGVRGWGAPAVALWPGVLCGHGCDQVNGPWVRLWQCASQWRSKVLRRSGTAEAMAAACPGAGARGPQVQWRLPLRVPMRVCMHMMHGLCVCECSPKSPKSCSPAPNKRAASPKPR